MPGLIWFLVIAFIHECMHVYAPEAIITSGVIYNWLNNWGCFSALFYSFCNRCLDCAWEKIRSRRINSERTTGGWLRGHISWNWLA